MGKIQGLLDSLRWREYTVAANESRQKTLHTTDAYKPSIL